MSTLLVINDQKRLWADSVTQLIQHKNTRFQSKRPNLHLLVHQLNIPWAEFIPNSTFNFYRTMSGGKRYALKDYPASESKHSPTRNFDHVSSISAYLSVCLSACKVALAISSTICHINTTPKLCGDCLQIQTAFIHGHSAGFAGVYF